MVGPSLKNFKQLKPDLYIFSHSCEDTTKSRVKARAYLYRRAESIMMKCHHCGASMRLGTFLSTVSSFLSDEYKLEHYKEKSSKSPINHTAPAKVIETAPELLDDVLIGLKSLDKLASSHPAVLYSKRRKIPMQHWKDIFFAPKFNQFAAKINERFKHLAAEKEHPRLLFPYFTPHGKVFAVSGRAFGKEEPKYIILTIDSEQEKIYGTWKIDPSKTIYVVEGQIDSLCVDNAVAVGHADYTSGFLEKIKTNAVIIPDNDYVRNKEVANSLRKAIKAGYRVSMFPDTYKFKDLNDAMKAGYSSEELETIINQNVKQGIEAEFELITRRKC